MELLPCALCGRQAVIYPAKGMQVDDLARCSSPTAECILSRYGPFNIQQWNRRPPLPREQVLKAAQRCADRLKALPTSSDVGRCEEVIIEELGAAGGHGGGVCQEL